MMSTIQTLATKYQMQPHELQALTNMNDTPETEELSPIDELFITDLLDNTDEHGVYHDPKEKD